jgi:hypothetical protein
MPIMTELLGADAIFLLRLIFGPLQGMNLRNLIWHGFFGDEEFSEHYASLMMFVIISLADISGAIEAIEKGRRELLDLSKYDRPVTVPSFSIDIVDSSFFVPYNQRGVWKQALTYYQEGRNYHCLVLLFPLLENSLRCLFAVLNHCEDRVMSAERETTYLTFDHILSPQLDQRAEKNKLFTELDRSIL